MNHLTKRAVILRVCDFFGVRRLVAAFTNPTRPSIRHRERSKGFQLTTQLDSRSIILFPSPSPADEPEGAALRRPPFSPRLRCSPANHLKKRRCHPERSEGYHPPRLVEYSPGTPPLRHPRESPQKKKNCQREIFPGWGTRWQPLLCAFAEAPAGRLRES
jgi:hypothetical protein